MMLFNKANRGASGKEATNKVTNPNWITGKKKQNISVPVVSIYHMQPSPHQCQPPNSDKVASSGGLNPIFCVRHSLLDGCCVWARKGQLPPCKRQGKSNQKDGEAPKTFFPRSRLAQESPEGVGLWQWPCWLYLSLPCSTWQVFGLRQSHWKLWKGHGWFCASARNNLLPITWDHICFLHGCHAHPGTASAHLCPVTSKCWSQ